MPVTFRIERLVSGENPIVLRVCGRVQIERVNTIKELIEEETAKLALDLPEVTLANRDGATFLAVCELKDIELRNCPAFLRGWVDKRTGAHCAVALPKLRPHPVLDLSQ
jgi:hypothetical protein